jgi:hypothetical protein
VDVKTSSNAFALIVYKCFVSLRFLRETFIDMAFLICWIGGSTNAMATQLTSPLKFLSKIMIRARIERIYVFIYIYMISNVITYSKVHHGRFSWSFFHRSIPSFIHGWHHTRKKTLVEINTPLYACVAVWERHAQP